MDRTQQLEDQVKRLSRTVEEMRSRMANLEGRAPSQDAGSSRSSRRGFLRLGAAAAATAVGWMAAKALPASAADNGTMVLGTANLAESPTTIQGDTVGPTGPPIAVFAAEAKTTTWLQGTTGSFQGPLQGHGLGIETSPPVVVEGVDGWAGGALAYGVYGLTDAGIGVTGESSTGIGLYARSSGRISQDGPFPGPPTHIPLPTMFEQVRDNTGVLWIHNAGGPLGAAVMWRRVNTPRADTADNLGNAYKPLRIIDTRQTSGPGGPTLGPAPNGTTRTYPVAGDVGTVSAQNIPADAIAVFGNLTAVGGAQGGFMAIHPAGVAYDPANDPATFNFSANGVTSNGFFCGLGTGSGVNHGKISVYIGVSGSSKANFIIDITGYVQ